MGQAKQGLAPGDGAEQVFALKSERDRLRRALKTGSFWSESGSI